MGDCSSILDKYKEQISDYKKLKLDEAKKLYIKYIDCSDLKLKKLYMNKLILGTLHVVYNFIESSKIYLFISPAISVEDIINSFVEVWINKIKDGELLNIDYYSLIFVPAFFNDVCDKLNCQFINTIELYGLTIEELSDLFYYYILFRSANDFVTQKKLTDYFNKFQNIINNWCFIELFEKIYINTGLAKFDIVKLGKTKIRNYFKLIISTGLFDSIPNNYIDSDVLKEYVEDKIYFASFRKEVDKLLSNPRTRDIIYKRNGLWNEEIKTYEEIANEYNITRNRVMQIEDNFLRDARRNWNIIRFTK